MSPSGHFSPLPLRVMSDCLGSTPAVAPWPRERPRCGAKPAFMAVGARRRVGWIPGILDLPRL
jgi:hypothetical protein